MDWSPTLDAADDRFTRASPSARTPYFLGPASIGANGCRPIGRLAKTRWMRRFLTTVTRAYNEARRRVA